MKIIKSTPVLESTTTKGLEKFWQGHASTDGNEYYTYSTYWQKLKDGSFSKVQESEKTRVEIKNIGRANETTLEEQSLSELASDEKKQRDKGYHENGESSSHRLLPMLALDFRKAGHRLNFGCYIQPKFDGNRAITNGKEMWTRKGILYLPEIVAHIIGGSRPCPPELTMGAFSKKNKQVTLADFFAEEIKSSNLLADIFAHEKPRVIYPQTFPQLDTEGYLIDGELIMPPGVLLQRTRSASSKYSEASHQLIYRVYDVIDPNLNYIQRYEIARRIVEKANNPNIVLAPVVWIENLDEMYVAHQKNLKEGWEGSILRDPNAGYAINHRVPQLMKLKDFAEEEFEIIDVVNAGVAKMEGCAKFVMQIPNKGTFECMPIGTMEARRQMLIERNSLIGQMWTVRWPLDENGGLSEDGKPKYAQAVSQRLPNT